MTDDVPDLPRHRDDVIYGATCAAYHQFYELALSVPPNPRLEAIRAAITALRSCQFTCDADVQRQDADPAIRVDLQDLNKFTNELLYYPPTNWSDIVARAEMVAFYAPNAYCDDPIGSKHRRLVTELIETILGLSRRRPGQVPIQEAEVEPSVEKGGCVYLVQAGQHFKIGRTNSLEQRMRALAIQLPEKPIVIHHIKTDDPAGIEKYWHQRFANQRKNGEWFELSIEDVEVFKARAAM
jgi:hypothetical protein